jgi:ABC-type transport system involved in cytochrome c biogenesis permease component
MARVLERRSRVHFLALFLYAILAAILSWPLVRHLGTHVPGSYTWAFDEYTFLWNSWWFRYSLFELGHNPLYSTYTFYPLGVSLVLYTYNLFNALISLPLQPFLSLPAISNLTFLSATVFSGYGTFLLVDHLGSNLQSPTRSTHQIAGIRYCAAFLAGLIYAFGSYRMIYAAIGHYDMWSTAWIPFYVLFLVKTIHAPQTRNAILAGIFLALAMLSEMIFGVFLGILTLILLAFGVGRRGRAEVAGGLPALLKRLAVMGLVVAVLYLPVLVPILREMLGGYELAGWGGAERLSADLLGLVTPTALHPLGGDWAETLRQTREGTARFRDVNTVFLGWAGLALAVVGAVRYRRRLAAWTTSLVVFAVLSLGPLLQINGRSTFDLDGLAVDVPLPFILLHYIPLVKANRVPNRFSVVLMLALAVLAGFGAYWLLAKLKNSRILHSACSLLLASFLLFEHWSVPLPLTDARIPPVYEQVAAEPGDFTILQLPLGWRNSFGMQGAEDTQTQYYQAYHHKRLLSGNISRNPPFKFDYFRRVPILDSLIALETYGQVGPERRTADRATAAEFVRFYDIRYVVVAPGIPDRPPYVDTRDATIAYVNDVLPVEKVYDQDGWILYRVNQPPLPATLAVDFGSSEPGTAMALGEGWAEAEEIQGATANWAEAQKARIFLPAAGGMGYRLTVTALPFNYPGAEEQKVTLQVNGHRLEPIALAQGWKTYTWEVPGRFLRQGLNDVRFEFDRLDAPADVLPGNGGIGSTGVQAPTTIEVNSGGVADFAYITVGTGDSSHDGSVHRPGYNVAVIHPRTGRLLDRQGFDTTPSGSEAEAAALAAFIEQVPDGRIVVVAMQGDGAFHLTDEAVAAFREIGGQADLRGRSGWSHAIVGVKGAAPGAALEAAGPDNGWLRVAPDQRTLAMAVDAIVWEQAGEQE